MEKIREPKGEKRGPVRRFFALLGPGLVTGAADGLIGVGFLAIPTLAGSAAYVFTETFGFRQGLDEKLRRARAFYGIPILSIIFGMALTFTPIKPMDALFEDIHQAQVSRYLPF